MQETRAIKGRRTNPEHDHRDGGSQSLDDKSLIFTEPASTKMAYPAPMDELEGHLRDMLAKVRRWRIKSLTLELWDESGTTVGLLEAVYL